MTKNHAVCERCKCRDWRSAAASSACFALEMCQGATHQSRDVPDYDTFDGAKLKSGVDSGLELIKKITKFFKQ